MRTCIAFCALWITWLALGNAVDYKIICYYGSWAVYRKGNAKMDISDINATLCTHVIYAFIGVTKDAEVQVLDPWVALPDNGGRAGYRRFNALKKQNPELKTLVASGGWDQGSETYSKIAGDPALRSTYVKSVVDFVRRHEFDGFDIDWQYPAQRGGVAADVQNYVLLLKELRASLDEHGLILSAAVGASQSYASVSYDIPQISKYLDFINLLLYDFHGAWDSSTGHSAPLYPAEREVSELGRTLNVNNTVHYWLAQGAPAEKLILGIGFYGISFTLVDPSEYTPGAPASGPGLGGRYINQSGWLGYNEICTLKSTPKGPSWTHDWDEEQRMPYAHSGNQWVSYDDVRSIAEKANYAQNMGLGGAMVWSIETDDHRGGCGDRYPLLKTLNRVLRQTGESIPLSGTAGGSGDADQEAIAACARSSNKYIRHSQNCAKFWICRKIRDNDFIAVSFSCGDGLHFDTNKIICKDKNLVQC